jgi:predicted small secreted protein
VPRIAATTLLVAVLALGSGCNGDSGTGPDVGSTSDAPSSPSSSAASDVESGSASAEPATGIRLSLPHSTVRVPERWTEADVPVTTLVSADAPDSASLISLGEIEGFGSTSSADELADTALRVMQYRFNPKKLPVTELDGVEAYHLAGKIQPLRYLEEFGAIVDDRIVTLSFEFSPEASRAERDEIVDSVTATFRWK